MLFFSPVTVSVIRNRFPKPSCFTDGGYCVGGAFCIYTGCYRPFPSVPELESQLRLCNSQLTPQAAHDYAVKVINLNDTKKYQKAWEALDKAIVTKAIQPIQTSENKS